MKVRLEVELSSTEAVALVPQLEAARHQEDSSFFAVTVPRIALLSGEAAQPPPAGKEEENDGTTTHPETTQQSQQPAYAALFLPATLTESALDGASNFVVSSTSSSSTRQRLSQRLLAMVHPFLAQNVSLHGIIQVQNNEQQHAPADIALVDLQHTPPLLLQELLQTTNGKVVHAGPALVLKVLLIHTLQFVTTTSPSTTTTAPPNSDATDTTTTTDTHLAQGRRRVPAWSLEIPSCPVCLHRMDPLRLGLPAVDTLQLCSKFCTPPNLTPTTPGSSSGRNLDHRVACAQQRLLRPWPRPNICAVCQIIDRYWQFQLLGQDTTPTTTTTTDVGMTRRQTPDKDSSQPPLLCGSCGMQQTLWVCLTCGFLGCGRYSNKHAAQHFVDSGHAFSLELATLRIWDYVTGGFVQRMDLLECPSSWPLLQPWIAPPMSSPFLLRGAGTSTSSSGTGTDRMTMHANEDLSEKTPKKAIMVGEEYEVLLHSALEDQAQHYEGKLSQLRAQLTEQHVDQNSMTTLEAAVVDKLQTEIASLQVDMDHVSRQLLEAQSQEAEYRATSTRLLRQQQVTQDLVHKLEAEVSHERHVGHQQVEELEQQIADLQANQRMRDQFTHDTELQQAQIWGLSATPTKGKKGKKQRRGRG